MEELKNQEIETLAWGLFQKELGIRFKRNLTADEMKEITDTPAYQVYRDKVLKVYNQRQIRKEKAIFNKKYPIIDVPSDGKRNWMGGARIMLFVYSKYKGNFVLRGYHRETEAFLKSNFTHYFYYKSMWCGGETRGHWDFWLKNIGIFEPSKSRKDWKYIIRPYSEYYYNYDAKEFEPNENALKEKTITLKRLPKRWIPEFDIF
jgi:hypothetical protein